MTGPKRPRSHVLETEARNNLRRNIPDEWVIQRVENDYGIDNHVEIVQDNELDGNFFSIQLKGTDRLFENQDYVTVRMRTTTIQYLMNRLELVMIVIYVSNENESYWIWLRDAIEGIDYKKETFTIGIPKKNELSQIKWNEISTYSNLIRNQKIDSARGINYDYEN